MQCYASVEDTPSSHQKVVGNAAPVLQTNHQSVQRVSKECSKIKCRAEKEEMGGSGVSSEKPDYLCLGLRSWARFMAEAAPSTPTLSLIHI